MYLETPEHMARTELIFIPSCSRESENRLSTPGGRLSIDRLCLAQNETNFVAAWPYFSAVVFDLRAWMYARKASTLKSGRTTGRNLSWKCPRV